MNGDSVGDAGAAGLAALATSINLTELDIGYNGISATGVARLAALASLTDGPHWLSPGIPSAMPGP